MLAGLAAAAAGSGAAGRLLKPRREIPKPLKVDLAQYFSEEEIARGRSFTRPQLVLGLARSGVALGILGRMAAGGAGRPGGGLAAGARAGAAIALIPPTAAL